MRQLRALLRHRASLVRLGTQLRNRIHAVAADHGYDRSASYTAIASRRGKKIATIAIARKLLTRAWHLLDQMQPAEASTLPRRP